jgi:hypothetical protein
MHSMASQRARSTRRSSFGSARVAKPCVKAGIRRRGFAFLALLCVLLRSERAHAGDPSKDVPSVEACRAAWASFYDRLTSLRVEYQLSTQALVEPAVLKRYLGVVRLVEEQHIFAFKGEQRYFAIQRASDQVQDFAPDVEPVSDATAQPAGGGAASNEGRKNANSTLPVRDAVSKDGKKRSSRSLRTTKHGEYAFNGNVRQIRSRDTESLNLLPKSQLAGSDLLCFDQTYLHAQYRTLPDVFDKADSRAGWRLPDALNGDDVHVRRTREDVDGRACAVIELRISNKVFWCDPELGYAVRQWEGRTPQTNILCNRYHLRDYRQVAPSVWLPFEIVQEACAPQAPEEYRSRPLMTYTVRVTRLQVNDVPDATFTLAAPPGTRVADRTIADQDQPVMYRMPADPSKIPATIAEALARRAERLIDPPRRKWVPVVVGVNVAALLAMVWLLRRRRRWRQR